jgi:hypothetical protein
MDLHRGLRRRLGLPLLVLGGLATPFGVARAGDPPPAAEVRVFEIADLLWERLQFQADRGPFPVPSDRVNDEHRPLFGSDRRDPVRPFGGPDDLVELVKQSSREPGEWDAEGTTLATDGERRLVVRGPRRLVDDVARVLEGLRARLLPTYTVDVAVFAGEPSGVTDADLVGRVGRDLAPLAVARASALAGGRSVGFDGRQTAYVADYDVEVAQESEIGDPIVGVMPSGLAFEARVGPAGTGVRLEVSAWWAQPAGQRVASPPETSRIDLPAVDGAATAATLDVTPGAWTVLPSRGVGTTGFVFAARVTPSAFDPGTASAPLAFRPVPLAMSGPLRAEIYDIGDFAARAANRRGRDAYLPPSNFTPPEPQSLADAAPRFEPDRLVELLKDGVGAGYFDAAEGSSIRRHGDLLLVRSDEARHRGIASALAAVRAATAPTTRVRAVTVAVPAASLPELWTGLDGALVADGGVALLARPGARVLDRASLRLVDAQRDATEAGRVHAYVADHDVEIAQASAIGNPIVQQVFSGATLDVEAGPAGGGGAVVLDVRYTRSALGPIGKAPTTVGEVDLPTLRLVKHRGALSMRSGTTRVLSVGLEGRDVVLTLLSATRE